MTKYSSIKLHASFNIVHWKHVGHFHKLQITNNDYNLQHQRYYLLKLKYGYVPDDSMCNNTTCAQTTDSIHKQCHRKATIQQYSFIFNNTW